MCGPCSSSQHGIFAVMKVTFLFLLPINCGWLDCACLVSLQCHFVYPLFSQTALHHLMITAPVASELPPSFLGAVLHSQKQTPWIFCKGSSWTTMDEHSHALWCKIWSWPCACKEVLSGFLTFALVVTMALFDHFLTLLYIPGIVDRSRLGQEWVWKRRWIMQNHYEQQQMGLIPWLDLLSMVCSDRACMLPDHLMLSESHRTTGRRKVNNVLFLAHYLGSWLLSVMNYNVLAISGSG